MSTTILSAPNEIIEALAKICQSQSISDIKITAGERIQVRDRGDMKTLPYEISGKSGGLSAAIAEWLERDVVEIRGQIQEGFDFRLANHRLGNEINLRGNLCYTGGSRVESVVFRVSKGITPLAKNFFGNQLNYLEAICNNESGLVLVTGPTGSGKTTTLYGMLQHILNNFPLNIVTAEDPIEAKLHNATGTVDQLEVGTDIASFDRAIQAFLRRDPDVILFGELRDHNAAEKALQAAQTGHLVFATLHVDSAAEAPERLINFFPDSKRSAITDLLAGNLRSVIHQRLVTRDIPRRNSDPSLELPDRLAILDILHANPAVINALRNAKNPGTGNQGLTATLIECFCRKREAYSMNRALAALVLSDYITTEKATNLQQGGTAQSVAAIIQSGFTSNYRQYIAETDGFGKMN